MPVIRDIRLSLNTRDVVRRQGLERLAKVRPQINSLIRESLASLKKSHLTGAVVTYEYCTVNSMNDG